MAHPSGRGAPGSLCRREPPQPDPGGNPYSAAHTSLHEPAVSPSRPSLQAHEQYEELSGAGVGHCHRQSTRTIPSHTPAPKRAEVERSQRLDPSSQRPICVPGVGRDPETKTTQIPHAPACARADKVIGRRRTQGLQLPHGDMLRLRRARPQQCGAAQQTRQPGTPRQSRCRSRGRYPVPRSGPRSSTCPATERLRDLPWPGRGSLRRASIGGERS